MPERFFAPCPRGLEAALARELTALGAQGIVPADGGVGFEGELDLAYRANLESRLASRILWRVGGGAYRNERDLYALVQALDWPRLFLPSRSLRVDVAATRSPLQSLEFATLRVKDAVSVFGSNDEIAAGVLAAAHSDGINVPYELSIAGFEDSPFSKQSWPALTTARQATEDIARHAAQRLIDDLQRAANGEPVDSRNEGFRPELVVRGSTAPRHTVPSRR